MENGKFKIGGKGWREKKMGHKKTKNKRILEKLERKGGTKGQNVNMAEKGDNFPQSFPYIYTYILYIYVTGWMDISDWMK